MRQREMSTRVSWAVGSKEAVLTWRQCQASKLHTFFICRGVVPEAMGSKINQEASSSTRDTEQPRVFTVVMVKMNRKGRNRGARFQICTTKTSHCCFLSWMIFASRSHLRPDIRKIELLKNAIMSRHPVPILKTVHAMIDHPIPRFTLRSFCECACVWRYACRVWVELCVLDSPVYRSCGT